MDALAAGCIALGTVQAAWSALELVAVRAVPDLPESLPIAPPRITAVIAVRDGAHEIEQTVRALLAQQAVVLDIVVVDDRSTDATAAIVERIAQQDPRVRLVRVRDLPQGWLGKPHALAQGVPHAQGEWLLFTDADARFAPQALARAVAAATAAGAGHVMLLPGPRQAGIGGWAGWLAFQLMAMPRLWFVQRDPPRTFAGIGACNLVRAADHRAVGGHEALAMEVLDDVYLGFLLFRHGVRARAWFAPRELTVDWGCTIADLLFVLEKNFFAATRFRTVLALGASATALAVFFASVAAPWLHPLGGVALAGALSAIVPGLALARRDGAPRAAALLVPLARVLLPLALLRSTVLTLVRGGIRWRGTHHPLRALRAGMCRH